MARVRRRPGIGRVTRYCVPVAAASGPTVLLDADWSTNTILNDSDLAITNGDPVKSWAFATGGTATQALAVAAGADPQYLTWVAASGVHTNGLNAAVTLPTPVTIPADTEFRLYCRGHWSGSSGGLLAFLSSPQAGSEAGGTAFYIFNDTIDTRVGLALYEGGTTTVTGTVATGDVLVLFSRNGAGDIQVAWSGSSTLQTVASLSRQIQIAHVLAFGNDEASSANINVFSTTGNYFKSAKLTLGVSGRDTVYEAANGGTL